MKHARFIHFACQALGVVIILLSIMAVLPCGTWGQSSSSGMTWKEKFPYLWNVAYPDKSSKPEPEDITYRQFVKAVAAGIRRDPVFLKRFQAYALKEKVDLHSYMLSSYVNPFGMSFQYISPGMFKMGSPERESGRDQNETRHQVFLTEKFLIQTTEVTQAQWKAVLMEAETRGFSIKDLRKTPSSFKACGPDCPVESVSWDDVQKWIQVLNLLGYGTYFLPTEAQWELAARAGSVSAIAHGTVRNIGSCSPVDPGLDKMGWYCGNSDSASHPVAKKTPNTWGLYDMHGNVWEWCRDWYGEYPSATITADPAGPVTGSTRVLRGGSWGSNSVECRSAFRFSVGPGYRSRYFGFRLVMVPGG